MRLNRTRTERHARCAWTLPSPTARRPANGRSCARYSPMPRLACVVKRASDQHAPCAQMQHTKGATQSTC